MPADRNPAEFQLRESRELNRRIIEAIPGGIVHVSTDGAVLTANAEALRILGMSYDIATDRYVKDWDPETIWEDGSHCSVEDYPVTRALVTGESQPRATIGIRRPDGKVSWAIFTAIPVKDPATGAVSGAVVTFLDITEEKRRADADKLMKAQIRHTQKLESLGVMAGGIAHDFNNLLTGVLGNAGIALARLPPDSSVREELAEIQQAAEQAAELCRQMLAYAGRGSLARERCDLAQLVRETTQLLSASMSKKATLNLDLNAVPPIVGDRSQVRQVVMNLVINASEALAGDTGTVTVRTGVVRTGSDELARTYVDDELPGGEYAFIEVVDTGRGMNDHVRARLFDPFFTTKRTGRGLGMAAVLGVVRGHRGAIEVDSEPDDGTTIRILFPVAGPARTVANDPGGGTARKRATVLVVDDEPLVRKVARKVLLAEGYDVIVAADGIEGIEQFREHAGRVDLVVLDATMPRMSGEEVAPKLLEIRADVPIILSSGFTEAEASRQFGDVGLAAYVQKPYRPEDLTGAIERVLGC